MSSNVYILGGKRTAIGSFMGSLSTIPATRLGAEAIKGALNASHITGNQVDEVFMGQVLPAGVGQAPARQATLFAELPNAIPCNTINKVCGSGLKTIIMGAQSITIGDNSLVVAGGMENMSLAPHLLMNSRNGYKFGATEIKDSMQWDGLWDVYTNQAMGNCAEECVKKFNLTREEQDQFAIRSYRKAQEATKEGTFKREIVPIVVKNGKEEVTILEDEEPFKVKFDKIPSLRPAFDKNGTITAANASSINDGASAVVLGGDHYRGQAAYRIVAYAGHAHHPTFFTTAPVLAMQKCLQKAQMQLKDIDLFEINEAFSAVTMAAMKELHLDEGRVNIFGGAVSLGHPIGCSGTRIVVTLMNALESQKAKYGMASICIGGGEALAMIIERL